ncbi:ABC transporter ATP-binding protein [Actinoallomurus sp. NPDC052274]|uniref:ABC transporter ATP-binding protein n=1 Tax=Actinoallomurus sp. NPDC052274 TaxID=3155420 RepID=UPI00341F65ED
MNDAESLKGARLKYPKGLSLRAVTACSLVLRSAPIIIVLYVGLSLMTGTLPVTAAWLTKLLLEDLARGVPLTALLRLAAGLSIVGVVVGAMPHLTEYLRSEMERRVRLEAEVRLFTAMDRFVGLARFEDPKFLDRLRLAQQSGGITSTQLMEGSIGVIQAAITITGFLGSLLVLSPLMTALVLGAGAPTLFAQISMSRRRARTLWKIGPAERREFFYRELLSNVAAAKEVRLLGLGSFLRGRMLAERRTADSAIRLVDRRQVIVQVVLGLMAAVVSGGGLMWAVGAAHQGRLSAGDITMFVAAVAGVQSALATLAMQVARSHQALLMFDHYIAVTTASSDLPITTNPHELPRMRQGIELRDVWFRYSPDHPWILRGVNLQIPYGCTLALVGLNGAGKSTLVKLLCRFYDPTRGAILWDGIDISEVDVTALRQRIGAVFQDYMNYDMTAADNIALGDLSAFQDRERMRTSAQRAGIHEKLSRLPHGYDTLLTRMFLMESEKNDAEAGVVLSGGEWQRVALARAFFRSQRDLMILDEPSAGLDAEAEHQIHSSLRQHRNGQTSLLISHRLGAVREADLIVVLSGGRIVEQGDHEALVAAGGEYAQLFTLQASGYQIKTDGDAAFVGEL